MTDGGGDDVRRDGRGGAAACEALVQRWVSRGLRRAVICPGSRSTPMALALHRSTAVDTDVVIDERSAGFVALGAALAGRRPVAVLTTSGTGAVELHPSVVEADLAGVPLLCLTADRPHELQGVGAPQTIDQVRLFGSAVRGFFAIDADPATPLPGDAWSAAADAVWDRVCGDPAGPGPVQVNLAFREPLVTPALRHGVPVEASAVVPALDSEPVPLVAGEGLDPIDSGRLAALLTLERGLVLCGDGTVIADADLDALQRFARHTSWVVAADPLSGASTGESIRHLDGIVRAAPPEWEPEVVVRIGGLPSSRIVREALDRCGAAHVGLRRGAAPPDPGRTLDASIRGDTASVLETWMAGQAPIPRPNRWQARWHRWDLAARRAVDDTLAERWSEPWVVRETVRCVDATTPVVVSSSMPIRDLEWYGLVDGRRRVLANRGANGIDGVVSTALGVAIEAGTAVAVVGDVAAVHDVGALATLSMMRRARHASPATPALLVVVVDNGGGGIFSFLPQGELLPGDEFEALFGTPHGIDLAAVASAMGIGGVRVASVAEFREAVVEWFETPPDARTSRVVVADMVGAFGVPDGSAGIGGASGSLRSDGMRGSDSTLGSDGDARARNAALHRELNEAIAAAVRDVVCG